MIIYILLVRSNFIWEAGGRIKNRWGWGFPGGSGVKNPPANAVETGWVPIQEDPHATEQLSPEPQLLSLCSRAWEMRLLKPEHLEPCCEQEKLPGWKATRE